MKRHRWNPLIVDRVTLAATQPSRLANAREDNMPTPTRLPDLFFVARFRRIHSESNVSIMVSIYTM